jgi:hypothetical protein
VASSYLMPLYKSPPSASLSHELIFLDMERFDVPMPMRSCAFNIVGELHGEDVFQMVMKYQYQVHLLGVKGVLWS